MPPSPSSPGHKDLAVLLCVAPEIPKATFFFSFLPNLHLPQDIPALMSLLGRESLPGKPLQLLNGGRFLSPCSPTRDLLHPSRDGPGAALGLPVPRWDLYPPHLQAEFFLVLVCTLWVDFPSFWGTAKLLHPQQDPAPLGFHSSRFTSSTGAAKQNPELPGQLCPHPGEDFRAFLTLDWLARPRGAASAPQASAQLREAKQIAATAGPNPISTGTGTGGNQSHSPDLTTKLLQKSLYRGRRANPNPGLATPKPH